MRLLLAIAFLPLLAHTQATQPAVASPAEPAWVYRININIGCNLLFTYGPSLSVYSRSLGANLNPLVGDIQLDFINSFGIGGTWGGTLPYLKYFRTIGNVSFYNVITDEHYAALVTSNLVPNSHKRNQTVGSVTFSAPGVTVNYYGDQHPRIRSHEEFLRQPAASTIL